MTRTCVRPSFGSRIWKLGIRFSGIVHRRGCHREPAMFSPGQGVVSVGFTADRPGIFFGFAGIPRRPAGHSRPDTSPRSSPQRVRRPGSLASWQRSPRGMLPPDPAQRLAFPVPRPCSRGSTWQRVPGFRAELPPVRWRSAERFPRFPGSTSRGRWDASRFPGELPRIRAAPSVPRRGRVQRVGAAFNVPGSAGFEVWPAGNVPGELPRPFRVVPLARKNDGAQAFAALHPAGA